MKYIGKLVQPSQHQTGCLIVGVYSNGKLTNEAEQIDSSCNGIIAQLIEQGDIKGDVGNTLLIPCVDGIKAERILLVGLGKPSKLDRRSLRQAIIAATKVIAELGGADATFLLSELPISGLETAQQASDVVTSANMPLYRYDTTKSKPAPKRQLKTIIVGVCDESHAQLIEGSVATAASTAKGVEVARELGNLPGNICTPTYLAEQAIALDKRFNSVTTTILEEADMAELGMGSLLSVSRGSIQPAKLIVMEYKGGKAGDKPHVIVGKGLTFDSGGISLKPGPGMDQMKMDMCGGAAVFGTAQAVAEIGLKLNVVFIVPSSENMPDADASKPGDVVTAMDGTTIEVLNTDAEGRLILCDALCYAARFEPKTLIDLATLTGAVVVALGHHNAAVMGNDNAVVQALLDAGKTAGDGLWQLPLGEDYHEQLKSPYADLANIGGPAGGSITAASFLSHFTRKQRWAHLDIAGVAWNPSGPFKGALGRPVMALVQYLSAEAA